MKNQIQLFFTRLRAWLAGDSWEYPIDFDFEELDYQNEEYLEQLKKQKNRKDRHPLIQVQRFPPYHESFEEWFKKAELQTSHDSTLKAE